MLIRVYGHICSNSCDRIKVTMYSIEVLALLLFFTSEPSGSAGELTEHTAQSFRETLVSGKTSFIYFGRQADAAITGFLEQLQASADALEDYGISVGKVNCTREEVKQFCRGEEVMKRVYLFRGTDVLRSFDVDTVFDVNAIVSHVLFSVLYNEVRYVHTPADLRTVERTVTGKMDIVMGHVQALGLPEHRALMEAAFVYGQKYQFTQTTGTPLLKHMGISDLGSDQARLWFLHCSSVTRRTEPCPHTLLRKPLTTINIHTFLQMMETPAVTEADVDPADVKVVYSHLNIPLLFLFTQPETLQLDRTTAHTVAQRLRGEVGVVLIHRDSPGVKTPLKYNTAYQLPQEEVKYFSLKNIEEIISLFREQQEEADDEEEEEEEDDNLWTGLDDEVMESVYRDRGHDVDTETLTLTLTEDSFTAAVTHSDLLVVLFYLKWDAVSMAFLQSYVEVADALKDVSGVEMCVVDCGESSLLCSEQNITTFPSVLLYRAGEVPQRYRGMLGTDSLHRFLLLSWFSSPVFLSSSEEVLSFLKGNLYSKHSFLSPVCVLGLYSPSDPDVVIFKNAAKSLRGETLLGLFIHEEAEKWADGVSLPALLVSPGPDVETEVHSVSSSSSDQLISLIQTISRDPFPELTVEELPGYWEMKKPLLLLFIGDDESPETVQSVQEMRRAQKTGQLDTTLPCWIHLGRTPAGLSVLEVLVGFRPPLPALVVCGWSSAGEVYYYPAQRPLLSDSILQWLQSIQQGLEDPAGLLSDEVWAPPVPFYDFLAVMDEELPGYAAQRSPKNKPGVKNGQKETERVKERHSGGGEDIKTSSDPQTPPHTEL